MSTTAEPETPKTEETPKIEAETEADGDGPTKEEEEEATNIVKVLTETKVEGGKKGLLAMTKETFGMADGGSKKKTDVIVDTLEECLTKVKELAEAEKKLCSDDRWEFPCTPKDLYESNDDIINAFCMWAKSDPEEKKVEFNVSKAFRRLNSYVGWMYANRKDLDPAIMKLDSPGIVKAAKAWGMKLTTDGKNRMVWWWDFGAVDHEAIVQKKTVTPADTLRFVTVVSHVVMMDKDAQENGIYFCQAFKNVGFMKMFKYVPMEIGAKLDRLTIGVLPVKMKVICLLQAGRWIKIIMGIMRPFMSKKMRSRIVIVGNRQDPQEMLDKEFGREYIPKTFGGLEGDVTTDLVAEKILIHFKEEEAASEAPTESISEAEPPATDPAPEAEATKEEPKKGEAEAK
mmetsp:Transcript_31623/g.48410  ORF Transcript_31623/g.48410 Transcript_31623/m.48410 type:complete len:400 (-) Transcript_31623:87-1286(-)